MANVSQKTLSFLEVLIPFTKDYNAKIYGTKLAKLSNSPQRTVSRKLIDLEKKGLLKFKRDGKNKSYYLNLDSLLSFSLLQILENHKEIMFHINHPKLSLLLKELSLNKSVILFGSYAKGRAKTNSDIDLVILDKENKQINSIIERYPYEINAFYFTLPHLKSMLKKGEPLAKEIIKDHIFLGKKEKVIKTLIDYNKNI
jgi:predicted nucleotidyltransferase